MANKALAKRQKLTIRVEPSQRALKPRNPTVLPAKQRVAGEQSTSATGQRQAQRLLLQKLLGVRGDKDGD